MQSYRYPTGVTTKSFCTHITLTVVRNVYKMSGRSVSVYTDTNASQEYLCTLIQNEHEFCKLLMKRPQTVMFSNYI